MTTDLTDFVTSIVTFGTTLMHSAARLSHVGDGAVILVPQGSVVSRYTNVPIGTALTAVQTATMGISTSLTGTSAILDAAVTALQGADLVNVAATEAAGIALLSATMASLPALLATYVNLIQTSAPADAITLLFALANSIPNDGSPMPVLLGVTCLCGISQAIINYTPATSDESVNIITAYVSLFDSAIAPASDLGWVNTTMALSELRANVLQYLQGQIVIEPRVLIQSFGDALPDVAVAYALFGDANRAEEIVRMNNVTNPLIMPTTITYLSR